VDAQPPQADVHDTRVCADVRLDGRNGRGQCALQDAVPADAAAVAGWPAEADGQQPAISRGERGARATAADIETDVQRRHKRIEGTAEALS
jgi:hypothetical protein